MNQPIQVKDSLIVDKDKNKFKGYNDSYLSNEEESSDNDGSRDYTISKFT